MLEIEASAFRGFSTSGSRRNSSGEADRIGNDSEEEIVQWTILLASTFRSMRPEGEVVRESKTVSTAQAIADELVKAPSCSRIRIQVPASRRRGEDFATDEFGGTECPLLIYARCIASHLRTSLARTFMQPVRPGGGVGTMGRPSKKQKPTAALRICRGRTRYTPFSPRRAQRSTTPKSRSVSYLTDYETPLVPYP